MTIPWEHAYAGLLAIGSVNPFFAVPFVFMWLMPALAVSAILIGAYLFYIWPESPAKADQAIATRRPSKPLSPECHICGCALRAVAKYCPVCGTPRHSGRDAIASTRPHFAWVVHFRVGGETCDIHVPIDQLPVLNCLAQTCPVSADLLFAISTRKQLVVIPSDALVQMANELLVALFAAGASELLCLGVRRLRQVARKHAGGRIEREVGPRVAI
jgi:hypothetical protein